MADLQLTNAKTQQKTFSNRRNIALYNEIGVKESHNSLFLRMRSKNLAKITLHNDVYLPSN